MKGMSKADTLNLLESMGLNTIDRIVLKYPFSWGDVDDTLSSIYKWYPRVSLRSWTKDKIVCPFAPNKTRPELRKFLEDNWSRVCFQDELIFSEGIDPRTSQMCGKIAHFSTDMLLIEYLKGPGTVRDMENMKASHLTRLQVPISVGQTEKDGVFADLIRLSKYFFRKYPSRVLEWSIYPYHIGKNHSHLIFWEVL